MAVEYTKLTAGNIADLQRLLLPHWQRHWDESFAEAYFCWRFLDREDWEATLAYDGGQPVAFLDSFFRQCRISDTLVRTRQTADWFNSPNTGLVGLMMMRRVMEQPEPILVVGGTAPTHQLLPRLGWKELPALDDYVLPTGLGAAVMAFCKLAHFPADLIPRQLANIFSAPIIGRERAEAPAGPARIDRLGPDEALPPIIPARGSNSLVSVLGQAEVEWLRKAPDACGEYIWLVFSLDGKPAGFSLSALRQRGPFQMARLLHLQAQTPSSQMYRWMSAETAHHLAKCGAQFVTGSFSCPLVGEALRSIGFHRRKTTRAFWWHQGQEPPPLPYHLTLACGDEAILGHPD